MILSPFYVLEKSCPATGDAPKSALKVWGAGMWLSIACCQAGKRERIICWAVPGAGVALSRLALTMPNDGDS